MEADEIVKPEDVKTIESLEREVEKVFLLKDKGLVKMVVATVIANRMDLDPVWLMLIAPPSGGKTEMITGISGLDFVFPISDLTVNTFASGQKKTGKETSLLLKINNGIMAFKDFTSVLSKNKDAKKEIMGQLREIFDGEYVKRTGTGDDITWRGKVGAIAGATEVIYRHLEEMSAMGDRFIMYNIEQPDRLEVARRALGNTAAIHEKREHIKACFKSLIEHVIRHVEENDDEIKLSEAMMEELLLVADFSTRVRSAVMTDFKTGMVDFVPKAEMPMRVTSQLYTLAAGFIAINRANPYIKKENPAYSGQLSEEEKRLLFKTAFDSIPRTRRDVLYPLAQYTGGISTAGLATLMGLPSESVKKYLQQVNALGVCKRSKKGGKQGDMWKMEDKYRDIMQKIEKVDLIDGVLLGEDLEAEGYDEDDFVDTFDEFQSAKEVDSLDARL